MAREEVLGRVAAEVGATLRRLRRRAGEALLDLGLARGLVAVAVAVEPFCPGRPSAAALRAAALRALALCGRVLGSFASTLGPSASVFASRVLSPGPLIAHIIA